MTPTVAVGHHRRISRLFGGRHNRAVMIPLDATLISHSIPKPQNTVLEIAAGRPDAIIGFSGLLRTFHRELVKIPTILNLTGSTTGAFEVRKELLHELDTAEELGVEAVAIHVNVGGSYERDMLRNLALVAARASRIGMPILGMMYPRSEQEDLDSPAARARDPQRYAKLVAHAVRIGVDLGTDIVKTQFTGASSFHDVVAAAAPVPVVIAGGTAMEPRGVFEMTRDALAAGAVGVCYGRNVFEHAHPTRMIEALKAIVHEDAAPDRVEQLMNHD